MALMARTKAFCPHCCRVVPAGEVCPCRKRKRKPSPNDATRSSREPWRNTYSSPEFKRNRQIVIERQQGRCKDCGQTCAHYHDGKWVTKPYGGEVDHERPLCEGGTNDTRNLALRCKRCHSKAETKRRQARAAAKRKRDWESNQ